MSALAAPAGDRWWIEAAGRVWGPYPEARLAGFVGEGRLTPASLVGRSASGPFAPAALDPSLGRLFGERPAVAIGRSGGLQAPLRAPATPEPLGAARPMLVFAELRSTRADHFEAALAAHGENVRVAPGLWLVRARCAAAPLRNLLSRRLREGDVLLVTEVAAAQSAWFALGGETDRAMRRLLAEPRVAEGRGEAAQATAGRSSRA